MDISLSASCSSLCSTVDHLLMSMHVLFPVIHIISSGNGFLNLCSKGTCAMLVVTCIFWSGMSLVTASGNAHDGLGFLHSTVSKPALTMVKWQLVAQRAVLLSCSVLISSVLTYQILASLKPFPYREIMFDLITRQKTAWGGRDGVSETLRVAITTTKLFFQLEVIFLGSRKNSITHLTTFFICERIVLSAVQRTGLSLLEMLWNTGAYVTFSGDEGLFCWGEQSGNPHRCVNRANIFTRLEHTGVLHFCLALTSGSIRN